MCGQDVYLVRVIETHYGAQMWFFWDEGVADWVSDKARATRYGQTEAVTLAAQLSEGQEVAAAAVRETAVV